MQPDIVSDMTYWILYTQHKNKEILSKKEQATVKKIKLRKKE